MRFSSLVLVDGAVGPLHGHHHTADGAKLANPDPFSTGLAEALVPAWHQHDSVGRVEADHALVAP